MNISPAKKIISFILVVALTLFTGAGLYFFLTKAETNRSLRVGEQELTTAFDNIRQIATEVTTLADPVLSQFYAKPKLTAKTLTEAHFNDWDGQPGVFQDGYIMPEVEYGEKLPDFVPYISARQMDRAAYPEINDDDFTQAYENYFYYGLADHQWYWLAMEKIEGSDYVYAEFADAQMFTQIAGRAAQTWNAIDTLKQVYGAEVIVMYKHDGSYAFWPTGLANYEHHLSSLGFDDSVWETKNGLHVLDRQYYSYFVVDINADLSALVLVNLSSALKQTAPIIFPVLGLMFIILFVYLFWIFDVCSFVKNVRLTPAQKTKYSPQHLKSVTVIYGVVGGMVIFLVSIYASTLLSLYRANESCRIALKTLFEQVEASSQKVATYQGIYDDLVIANLTYLSTILAQHPELLNAQYLQTASEVIGADNLVVYGVDGHQLVTNAALRGLEIGGAGDSDGSFKTLQNGTPSLVRAPIDDEAFGLDMISVSYGVPLAFASNQTYGVLAAYVNPQIRNSLHAFDEKELMRAYTSPTGIFFTVDPETSIIKFATQPDLIGKKLTEIGMPASAIRDHFMDFFRLFEAKYYGLSETKNELIYYNAKMQDEVLSGRLSFSLVAVICYGVAFVILVHLALSPYQSAKIIWQENGPFFGPQEDTVLTAFGEVKDSVDISQRWNLWRPFQASVTPAFKARLLAESLLILISAGLVYFFALTQPSVGNSSILSYVISGEWTKGFNIFALTALLLLCGVIFFCLVMLELIGTLLNRYLDAKGETVSRLTINLLRYLLVITLIYQGADYFGFDTRAVIASIGLVSFALSLGLKDMVTDIVAGLTIVFEGEYQVGDIIEIAGFRGKVVEIGVRSTKLMGRGGNIKIISNRDVKNVLNMTHLNSWCALDVTVSNSESLARLEKIFAEELPKIGKKIDGLISGPYYKGVLSFGHNGQTLSIIAECHEEDFFKVQRELNRELTNLFDKYEVKL